MKVLNDFFKVLFVTISWSFVLATATVKAQVAVPAPPGNEVVQADIPDDSLGRRTPRGMVSGFIKAVSDQNYLRASQYLQLRPSLHNKDERERVVRTFQRLLDKGGNIMPYSWISNKNTGRIDDDLAAGVDLVGTVTVDG